jgi:hypothetical protein
MESVSVCLVLPYLPKAETKNPKISLFSKKLKKSSLFNYLLKTETKSGNKQTNKKLAKKLPNGHLSSPKFFSFKQFMLQHHKPKTSNPITYTINIMKKYQKSR